MHTGKNIHFKYYAFAFLFLLPFVTVLSQINKIRFNHLSVNDGLSQSTVNAILQDRYGYMWFGTQDGLNRYDGYNFIVYRNDNDDSTTISDNWVWAMLEDTRGDLWVGTYNGGLNRFDRNRNVFENYRYIQVEVTNVNANNVSCIAEDKSGTIWAGTWGMGIFYFNRGLKKLIQPAPDSNITNTLSNPNVRCMTVSQNGLLWIGTWDGLNVYNPITQQFIHYKHDKNNPKSISGDRIVSVFEDKKGNIWISTYAEGLNRFDSKKNEFIRYNLESNNVGQIAEDKEENLWIATRGDGLILLNENAGKHSVIRSNSRNNYGLSDESVYSIFSDRLGGIWIGTSGDGINYYNPNKNKFQNYHFDPNSNRGLNNPTVRAIVEDRFGNLWIGTRGGGLNCYNKKTNSYIYYQHKQDNIHSLSHNSVIVLYEDSRENLWVGTEGGGLDLFDRVNNRFIHHQNNPKDSNSISSNFVMTIYEDRYKNLWIGTAGGGLNRYDFEKKKFLRYKLSSNYIWALMEDKIGNLWIGTWGMGLMRFNPSTNSSKIFQKNHSDQNSISNNTVLSIFEDSFGNIWIGTNGGGLNRFNHKTETFTHFTEKKGLPNNVVYGILEDSNGNLWLSTNKGLSCFNPKAQSFKNYDVRDGLQSDEFNQGAYLKSKNGEFYFGGINGVSSFYPENIFSNINIPQIVLTDFKVFDKQIHLNTSLETITEINLSYKQNFFSFEFASLDYTAPEKNEYMYILEGYDNNWIYSGTRRYAAYTNLTGGEYVFRVRGSNNDGVWNNGGRSVNIIITPPFWLTRWFQVSIASVIIVFCFLFYRNRIYKIKKEKIIQQELSKRFIEFQEKEKQRIASELHDSLGQNLLIIKNALNQCEGNLASQNITPDELHEISEIAQESIDEVREISYDLHPHTLDRLGLRKAIQSCINKFVNISSIKFTNEIVEIDKLFAPIEEIHIFRIIQEALNNVVKHSEATKCSVSVLLNKNLLSIHINDNGKGFDANNIFKSEETYQGFGISNITERVRLLKGEIILKSSPNIGTSIYITFPITKAEMKNE